MGQLHPIKMRLDKPKRFWQLNPAGWGITPHEATVYMKSPLAACCEFVFRAEGLQCSVLHPVLVNVEIMKDLRAAAGGAGPQTFLFISH